MKKSTRVLHRRFAISAGSFLVAAAPSCSNVEQTTQLPPATTVRDSAGIEIVESHRPFWKAGEEWTLAREASLAIGKDNGPSEYLLDKVIGATRIRDGQIVVANNGSRTLRFFDAKGVFIRSVGREGDGPGEFASLNDLFRFRGDSLMTHDDRNSLIVFDSEGKHANDRDISIDAFHVLNIAGAFEDGTLLNKLGGEGYTRLSEAELDSSVFQNIDRDGKVLARFAFSAPRRPASTFAGNPSYTAVIGGRAVLEKHHVLPTFTHFAAGPATVFFGDSERFEFLVASSRGTLTRIIRVTIPLEKIPQSVKTDTARFRMGRSAQKGNETIWPDVYPPFRQLMVDRAGNLWAAKVPRAGESLDSSRYTVFDNRGTMLGETVLPTSLRILEIGSDYVLGLERNALDVEMVKLYALKK